MLLSGGAAPYKPLPEEKPTNVQTKTIDVYDLFTYNHQVSLSIKAIKVNKTEVLFIGKPIYLALIEKYLHFKGVKVNDNDTKAFFRFTLCLTVGNTQELKQKRNRELDKKMTRSLN